VRVSERVVGYRRRQVGGDDKLVDVDVDYPAQTFETVALWWDIPVAALRATDLARGWEGEYDQQFGDVPNGPGITVSIDLFGDENGAADYIRSNDFPDQIQQVEAPIQLGDDTVAYRGIWVNNGAVALAWRHGRTIFTVSYNTQPGLESFDPVIQVAKAVETRYQAAQTAAVP